MPEEEKTSEEESKSSEEKDKQGNDDKLVLTDEQIEALKSDERFQRVVQSEADKKTATIEKRLKTEQQSQIASLRQRQQADELQSLVDAEDYEGLGQRRAEEIKKQRTLSEAAAQISGTIEGVLTEHPEFRVLGNDKVEEIRQATADKGGTVVDFMVALSNARQTLAVGSAVEQASVGLLKEVDARLVSAGLKKRSEESGPDANVSGASGTARGDTRTEDEILGDPNTEVPVLEEILKKRGIKVR